MKKIFYLFIILLSFWAFSGLLWFHGVEVKTNYDKIEPRFKRPPTGGAEIKPRIIRYLWGLINVPERLNSNNINEYIDYDHIRNLSPGIDLGSYRCNFDARNGIIVNFVEFGPNSPVVGNYISAVISSFSGDYSNWKNAHITVTIDFDNRMINIQVNLSNEVLAGLFVNGNCPLGCGQIEYNGKAASQYLIAAKGFNYN